MLVSESAVKKYDQSSEVISNQSSSSSYSGSAILNDHESKMPISNQRRKKLLQQARLSESSLHQSNESFFTHIISLHRINQSVWPHGQLLSLNIKDCRHIKFNKDIFQKELKADADTTEITGRKRLSASALKHKRKFENMKSKLTPWPSSSQIISSPLFTDVGRAQAAFRNKNDLALSISARIREVTISSIQSTELSPNNKIEADDNVSNTIPIILIRRDPGYHFSSSSTSQEQDRRADTSHRIRARRDLLPVAAIGWDIIIPDHWGPSIWRALIFAGATAVGIEEVDRLQLLSAQPSFPRDYPDTPAGVEFWAARLRSLNKRNRLRPRRKQALSTVEYVPNWSSISKVFQLNRYRTSTMSSPAPTATDDNIHSEEPDSKPVDNNSLEHLNTINRVIRLKSDFSCYQPFTYSTIKNTAQSNIQTVTLAPEPRLNVTSGLVTLLIHIPGKGRSLDGAKILTPTSSDYDAWLSHRRSKQVPSLSRRLRGQRCSGDWTGVDLEILSKVRDKDREEQRMIIGYVTSGENDGGSHKCAGIGCVDSLELFRCIQQFYHLSQASITDKDPDDIHTINTHTFSSMESSEQIMMSGSIQNQGWRSRNGSRSTLVLLHNPYSRWLRPALVEYVLWDQL